MNKVMNNIQLDYNYFNKINLSLAILFVSKFAINLFSLPLEYL